MGLFCLKFHYCRALSQALSHTHTRTHTQARLRPRTHTRVHYLWSIVFHYPRL